LQCTSARKKSNKHSDERNELIFRLKALVEVTSVPEEELTETMNMTIGKQLEDRSSTSGITRGSAHRRAKARITPSYEERLLKERYFRLRTVMS